MLLVSFKIYSRNHVNIIYATGVLRNTSGKLSFYLGFKIAKSWLDKKNGKGYVLSDLNMQKFFAVRYDPAFGQWRESNSGFNLVTIVDKFIEEMRQKKVLH